MGMLCLILLVSCNTKKSDKESITIKDGKEKKSISTSNSSVPIMIDNKGIGPITSLSFDSKIDQNLANQGAKLFTSKCMACHKAKQKFIGPALVDIYKKRSPEWVMNMIMNPTEMLEKDPVAKALLKEYNNTIMINQNIPEAEARAMVEWFRTLE